jgi:ABC-type multidrug transport system fused ATPase/permease subunit
MYASERQVARLRLALLSAVLSQEIGAFDTDLTSGKIISGISNHMSIIQDAIGEKVCNRFMLCEICNVMKYNFGLMVKATVFIAELLYLLISFIILEVFKIQTNSIT